MRVSFLTLLTTVAIFSSGVFVYAETPSPFSTSLSLGSSGPQVLALQKILNQDPRTHIADTGPGSPGNETDYFGLLTKDAVIRFQEEYATSILVPAGLTKASGYVGSYTLAKLTELSASPVSSKDTAASTPSTATQTATTPLPSTPSIPTHSTTTEPSPNPNLKNIDVFLASVTKVAKEKGLSSSAIATIDEQIMKSVATTTDLQATFLKLLQDKSHQSIKSNSYLDKTLASIGDAIASLFAPQHAQAASGVPFGGALLFSFFCNQSDTWLITLEPLPPSYAALLTYVPESQAFLSYNIPYTPWLLGEYESGAGLCIVGACPYCYTIPSEGMISPEVGSSPY